MSWRLRVWHQPGEMWLSCQSQLHRQTFTPWVDTWRIMADPCTRELVPQIQHNLIIWAVLYQLWNCWDFLWYNSCFRGAATIGELLPCQWVLCLASQCVLSELLGLQRRWDSSSKDSRSLIIYHFQEPPINRLVQLESSLILNSTLVPLQIRNWERNEIFVANQFVEDFT